MDAVTRPSDSNHNMPVIRCVMWDIGFAVCFCKYRTCEVQWSGSRKLSKIRAHCLMRFLLIDETVHSWDCGECGDRGKVSKKICSWLQEEGIRSGIASVIKVYRGV